MTADGWLVVVDLQRVFGDPGSPWAAPRFGDARQRSAELAEVFGLGGRDGAWAYANLGVLVAFLIGLVGTLTLRRRAVRAQENLVR